MKKVLFMAPYNSIHTRRWITAMQNKGYKVCLLTQHDYPEEEEKGFKVYHLPFKGFIGYFLNVFFAKALIRQIKPDLLHASYASGYGTLARLVKFHPYILSVWGSDIFLFPGKSWAHRKLIQYNLASPDHVCSTSHVMADKVRELVPDIDKLSITPFGIDTTQLFPVEQAHKGLTVGVIKSLSHIYGVDIFIKAMNQVLNELQEECNPLADQVNVLIVGEGPDRTKLENLASSLGIDECIQFVGGVSHDKVASYYHMLDVYVAVSRSESFGVAVLEASACGLPVVVSNVGGLPEVVRNEKTGYIVESGSVASTAKAILKLIRNKDLRKEMGANGHEFVQLNYSWKESVHLMHEIYERELFTVPDNL